MANIFKVLGTIFYSIIILFLVIVATGTAFSVLKAPGGYRLFVVLSGSMEPKIPTASLVLVAPQASYQKGDVITFFANPNDRDLKKTGITVTHRILEVDSQNGNISFQTKGDANNTADREKVSQASVLGKVLLHIPYLGKVIAFTKTQMGFLALIIIPGTLIVYSELISIKNEISKMIKNRNKKQETGEEKEVEKKEVKADKIKLTDNKVKKTGRKFTKKAGKL